MAKENPLGRLTLEPSGVRYYNLPQFADSSHASLHLTPAHLEQTHAFAQEKLSDAQTVLFIISGQPLGEAVVKKGVRNVCQQIHAQMGKAGSRFVTVIEKQSEMLFQGEESILSVDSVNKNTGIKEDTIKKLREKGEVLILNAASLNVESPSISVEQTLIDIDGDSYRQGPSYTTIHGAANVLYSHTYGEYKEARYAEGARRGLFGLPESISLDIAATQPSINLPLDAEKRSADLIARFGIDPKAINIAIGIEASISEKMPSPEKWIDIMRHVAKFMLAYHPDRAIRFYPLYDPDLSRFAPYEGLGKEKTHRVFTRNLLENVHPNSQVSPIGIPLGDITTALFSFDGYIGTDSAIGHIVRAAKGNLRGRQSPPPVITVFHPYFFSQDVWISGPGQTGIALPYEKIDQENRRRQTDERIIDQTSTFQIANVANRQIHRRVLGII